VEIINIRGEANKRQKRQQEAVGYKMGKTEDKIDKMDKTEV